MDLKYKTKQGYYGKSLLNGTYVKVGKQIIAKIFPPHSQVDRFVILIIGYSNEPIETFYSPSLENALEFVQKRIQAVYPNEIVNIEGA